MSAHEFLFYCPGATGESTSVTIEGEEHHHLSRVLRLKRGKVFFVTGGRGEILECRAAVLGPRSTTAEVVGLDRPAPPSALTLALAVIKRENFERAFEQCVELGVTRCVPFVSDRSKIPAFSRRAMERLEKIAVSAMKQSFRAWLPVVSPAADFGGLIDLARASTTVVFGERLGPPPPRPRGDALVVVGPEAGLSHEEVEALEAAGGKPASVSRYRLRSQTAAVALVAAMSQPD